MIVDEYIKDQGMLFPELNKNKVSEEAEFEIEDLFNDIEDVGDHVNSPAHYGQGRIECIKYIEDFLSNDEYAGYLRGNIAKYLHRWRYKNGVEDLKKARWYLEALIQQQSRK